MASGVSVVQLDFFDAHDVNGPVIFTMTDEDDYFESLELRLALRGLGGGRIVTNRRIGHAVFRRGIFGAEVFVRVLIPEVSATKYLWGFFLDLRKQRLISVDEEGGERFTIAGPGPLFYLHRAILWDEQFSGEGWRIDRDNGVFRFEEDDTAGNVLRRLQREDQDNTIAEFLPDLTYGFDNLGDSAGGAWGADYTFSAQFELPIGGDYLEHVWAVQDAINEPLEYTMDLGSVGAPILRMDAWKSYGRDLSGSAFGAGVVLLKEAVNIESDLDASGGSARRGSQAAQASGTSLRKASHALVRGKDGAYGRAVRTSWAPGEYAKAVMIDYPRTANENVLSRAGLRWLRRQENADSEFDLEITPGFAPSSGHYMAGPDGTDGHVWLGDTITLKTGTDAHYSVLDYHYEPQHVTGIFLNLREATRSDTATRAARSWSLRLQLNVERNSDNGRADGGASDGSGNHSHGPNPKLCVPGTFVTPTVVGATDDASTSGSLTIPATVIEADNRGLLVLVYSIAETVDPTATWKPGFNSSGDQGTTEAMTLLPTDIEGSTDGRILAFWLPSPGISTGLNPHVEITFNGFLATAAVFPIYGVAQTTPNIGTNFGSGTSSSVTRAGDLVCDMVGWDEWPSPGTAIPDPTSGQTAVHAGSATDANYGAAGIGAGYGTASPSTWDLNASRSWIALAVGFDGAGEGSLNDGLAELVGTSVRAARCDHAHHVLRTVNPGVSDDGAHGYREGTWWLNTATGAAFISTDDTDGAAVWLQIGGLSGSDVQALIDAHTADSSDAHDASAISVADTGGHYTATDVEGVLAEIAPQLGGGGGGAHAASHEQSGADELEIASLATSETDTALVLKPDGTGGVAWGADATGGGGGGSSESPNYTGPHASGMRVTTIIASGTNISGAVSNLLFDRLAPTGAFFASGVASMTFQFPEAIRMTGMIMHNSSSANHGTVTVEGSNDGSAWTTLGTPSLNCNLGDPAGSLYGEITWTNANTYTYYRFSFTAASGSPWLQRVVFKTAPA